MNDIYDYTVKDRYGYNGDIVPMPIEMKAFLDDINAVCRKHGLSISHEDNQGGFIIELYKDDNIEWLNGASKLYRKEDIIPIDNQSNIC